MILFDLNSEEVEQAIKKESRSTGDKGQKLESTGISAHIMASVLKDKGLNDIYKYVDQVHAIIIGDKDIVFDNIGQGYSKEVKVTGYGKIKFLIPDERMKFSFIKDGQIYDIDVGKSSMNLKIKSKKITLKP